MSYVNLRKKYVFVHVPKTGGKSMSKLVGGGCHRTAAELIPRAPGGFFSWGFVRNPYARLLSAYSRMTQVRPPHLYIAEGESFAKLVHRLPRDMRQLTLRWPHWRPQTYFLCDESGLVLVDFVGRFEHFKRDWEIVCTRIGIDPRLLRLINSSLHVQWQHAYTDDMLAVVNDVYASDFATFGYATYAKVEDIPWYRCTSPVSAQPMAERRDTSTS